MSQTQIPSINILPLSNTYYFQSSGQLPAWSLDRRMLALSESNRIWDGTADSINPGDCYEGLLCYQQDVSKMYIYINTGSILTRTNTVNDWKEFPGDFELNVNPNTAVQFASGSPGNEVLSGSLDFVYDYNTQRVGLGLSNPLVKLHISGASNDTIFRISSPTTSSLVNVFGSGVTTIKYNDTNFEGLILENINSGSDTALTTLVLRDGSSIHRGGIDFAGGIYRNEGLRDSIIINKI